MTIDSRSRLRRGRRRQPARPVGDQLRPVDDHGQHRARRSRGERRPAQEWLQDKLFRRTFRRALLYRYGLPDDSGAIPDGAVPLHIGDNSFWVECPRELSKAWVAAVQWRSFSRPFNYTTLGQFLNDLAEDVIYGLGTVGKHSSVLFKNYLKTLLGLKTAITEVRTLAAQGIVVGGTTVDEVRLVGNTVRDSFRESTWASAPIGRETPAQTLGCRTRPADHGARQRRGTSR